MAYWGSLLFGGFGFFWLIIHFIRKEASTAVSSVAGLFTGALGFGLSFIAITSVLGQITEAGEMNGKTIFYFISSIIWAMGSVVGTYLLARNFSNIQSKTLKYYLLLSAISLLGLTLYLGWHGFVGLRFWAY